jgi:hypothetical protein
MTLGSYKNAAGSQGGSTTPENPITVPTTGGSGQSGVAVVSTDFCFLPVMAGGGTNASAVPTSGTGWSASKSDATINAGGARYAIYSKVIGADTTIVPDWPTAPGSGNNTAHLGVFFSGVSGIETMGSQGVPGAASLITTCPSITTSGVDRVAVAVAFNKGGSGGFPASASWSSGWTEIANQVASTTFFPSISVAYKDMAAAGATGDAICTWDYSTLNQVGIQFALTPAGLPLTISSVSVTPSSGAGPLAVTLTIIPSGGNGNPITYSIDDWGDGATSAGQSSNTFAHTYASVGSTTVRNGTARVTQT